MAKKVFYSFRYDYDHWRVQTIKNIGAIEGQPLLTSNKWEEIKRGGDTAIENWINDELNYKDCTIVLIGSGTAGRKWVNYEIKESWNRKKGLMGIHIHNMLNSSGNKSSKGLNPFRGFSISGTPLTNIVPVYDPPLTDSKQVYSYIANNIEGWIDNAIATRKRFS